MTQTTDTDLVERLNARLAGWLGGDLVNPDGPAAAAEIKRLTTQLADRDAKLVELKNPPKHHYWCPGEPDCPPELKAPNGELHTMRCKVCGESNPRNQICLTAIGGE
jgi:hypothetical protein